MTKITTELYESFTDDVIQRASRKCLEDIMSGEFARESSFAFQERALRAGFGSAMLSRLHAGEVLTPEEIVNTAYAMFSAGVQCGVNMLNVLEEE